MKIVSKRLGMACLRTGLISLSGIERTKEHAQPNEQKTYIMIWAVSAPPGAASRP